MTRFEAYAQTLLRYVACFCIIALCIAAAVVVSYYPGYTILILGAAGLVIRIWHSAEKLYEQANRK